MPGDGRNPKPDGADKLDREPRGPRKHGGWGHVVSGLVAESVEPADPSSEFGPEQSDGGGF